MSYTKPLLANAVRGAAAPQEEEEAAAEAAAEAGEATIPRNQKSRMSTAVW
jgi:hypothetical protein